MDCFTPDVSEAKEDVKINFTSFTAKVDDQMISQALDIVEDTFPEYHKILMKNSVEIRDSAEFPLEFNAVSAKTGLVLTAVWSTVSRIFTMVEPTLTIVVIMDQPSNTMIKYLARVMVRAAQMFNREFIIHEHNVEFDGVVHNNDKCGKKALVKFDKPIVEKIPISIISIIFALPVVIVSSFRHSWKYERARRDIASIATLAIDGRGVWTTPK